MEWPPLRKCVVASGVGILILLFPIVGRSEQGLPSPCPALPKQEPANTVSIHIAKAPNRPTVCAWVMNGSSVELTYGARALTLQKWEERPGQFSPTPQKWEEGKGRFYPFGSIGGVVSSVAFFLSAGATFSKHLPALQPAPPGLYRVCFHFRLAGQKEDQKVCSEEVMLP